MGILGPAARGRATTAATRRRRPRQIVDNEYSIIDATDLVMIDPVGTGFSKPIATKKGQGQGQRRAGQALLGRRPGHRIGRRIHPALHHREWPLGLAEVRAGRELRRRARFRTCGLPAGRARHEPERPHPGLAVLQHRLGDDSMGIDLPYINYISTFAATAWYYDAIPDKPASLEEYSNEVERFAIEEYAPALLKGYSISPEEKQANGAEARALHRHERLTSG
jgi:hypothetical protein